MTSEDQRVTVTVTEGVADVRLNRPDKRNALDPAMFGALVSAGERLKATPGVRVVVLSGEGPDFCAGLDFSLFQAMLGSDRLLMFASARALEEGRMQIEPRDVLLALTRDEELGPLMAELGADEAAVRRALDERL